MISTIDEPVTSGIEITMKRLCAEINKLPPHSVKRGKLQEHYSNLITLHRQLRKDLLA